MEDNYTITPGKSSPLGATWNRNGTNFSIFAQNAERVELCLFDETGTETARIELAHRVHHIFHCFVSAVAPGQLYGYMVYGPYDPLAGKQFNPNKLLIDPYAKAICGKLVWNPAVFGYVTSSEKGDLRFSGRDSAPYMPKSVVIDPSYDWKGDTPPDILYHQTVIDERLC